MNGEDDQTSEHSKISNDPTRLLALSDGVFAIIMTLLVLELHVPDLLSHTALDEELVRKLPTLGAYVFGFLLAGVYWIFHRDLFNRVRAVNYRVLWLNIVFLMIASLIPFGASLLGNYTPTRKLCLNYTEGFWRCSQRCG